jgi:ubiquinone/menaquinone biosynthesis C-methylase UbiE
MGFYSHVIFPWILEWAMNREALNRLRRELLSEARGEVLEIGFGTGVNLPFYPLGVRKLTTADPNPGMRARAQKRILASPRFVDTWMVTAETLPMPDNTFDTVVSTMTLCSISDADAAIREVYRVLKPGGRLLFLEHGSSPDRNVKFWQDLLTPVSKSLGDGCHLNRNIRRLLESQFAIPILKNFYLEDAPKIAGYMYQGIAQKPI